MSKNAYLIITDVHATYKNKRNRINYLSEVDFVFNKIEELIEKYSYDYNVNLIFLGDIIDVSFKSQDKAILYNNTMIRLDSMVDKIYSVVGNHEITYYIDNPFWTLMNKIDAPSVTSKLNKSWKPKGLMQIINVVDTLADGNVLFHFNHNIRDGVSAPIEGKYNIGLFHKDIISKSIINSMELNKDMDIFEVNPTYIEDNSYILHGYKYCFFGHMHKVFGKWDYIDDITGEETILQYLGSLGRSNHSEVNDNFLTRSIPAVIVTDGEFERVEDNFFDLPPRGECVNEKLVENDKIKYEKRKVIKSYNTYTSTGDDPINNMRELFADDPKLLSSFNELLTRGITLVEIDIRNNVEYLKWI